MSSTRAVQLSRSEELWATLLKLPNCTGRGNSQYQACCPAHDDRNPSLSIKRDADGKLLVCCHARCTTAAVVEQLGFTVRDLFPARHYNELGPTYRDLPLAACYSYYSEKGDLCFQVMRYQRGNDKQFPVRRPDGRGGWVWNLEGVRRVPYRLPELLAADTNTIVYLGEGEKNVDHLYLVGLLGTTNPHGAGKWRAEYSEYLRGRDVVLLQDNDEAGKEHVMKTAALLRGVARRMAILLLPNLKPHGDVSDWLHAGHTVAELEQLARSALENAICSTTPAAPDDSTPHADDSQQPLVRKSQATRLVDLMLDAGAELWHTPDGRPYATFTENECLQHWPLRSKTFRNWLARLFYRETRATPGAQAVQDALGVLEGHAQYDGTEYPIYVRLATYGGNYYFDLANERWEAVEVSPSGWRIVSNPPVRFRRPRGMMPLPTPRPGGCLSELRRFVNTASENDWVLLAGFLVGSLHANGPYPVLVLGGEQGSAKTTLARLIKSLLDPSEAPIRSEPRSVQDLIIAATNSWLPIYDNLSHVLGWLSDGLCRLSTGGGFATRELYTDSDEVLFNVSRPVILTSIEDVVTRGDLLDRAIMLTLAAIPETKRRPESSLWVEFDVARPRILGALLDAVSCALRNLPYVTLDRMPRMADFALWATAAEEALELPSGAFMKAYTSNQQDANSLALDADIVADKLVLFIGQQKSGEWQGTASELLEELNALVGETARKTEAWPKRSDKLSNRLRRLAPNLRSAGIDIRFSKSGRKRTVIVRKVEEISVPSVPASHEQRQIGVSTGPTWDASQDAILQIGDATLSRRDTRDATLHHLSNGNS